MKISQYQSCTGDLDVMKNLSMVCEGHIFAHSFSKINLSQFIAEIGNSLHLKLSVRITQMCIA